MARKQALDQFEIIRHLSTVRTIRIVIWALLAFAWVPLTSHCKLAAFFDCDFLGCHAELQASTDGSDPCDNEGCCQVESGQYHLPRQQETLPSGVWVFQTVDPLSIVTPAFPKEPRLGLLTAAPL